MKTEEQVKKQYANRTGQLSRAALFLWFYFGPYFRLILNQMVFLVI